MTIVYRSVPIEILPEGSIVHRHTSVLLDLKNRANVLEFMNVIVDETPMIPYEVKIHSLVVFLTSILKMLSMARRYSDDLCPGPLGRPSAFAET